MLQGALGHSVRRRLVECEPLHAASRLIHRTGSIPLMSNVWMDSDLRPRRRHRLIVESMCRTTTGLDRRCALI